MSRDYGVRIEEEGICLRGMFILDDNAVVQQVGNVLSSRLIVIKLSHARARSR
jgi:alkyl hydroperoxide reductase subunit AhpC